MDEDGSEFIQNLKKLLKKIDFRIKLPQKVIIELFKSIQNYDGSVDKEVFVKLLNRIEKTFYDKFEILQ